MWSISQILNIFGPRLLKGVYGKKSPESIHSSGGPWAVPALQSIAQGAGRNLLEKRHSQALECFRHGLGFRAYCLGFRGFFQEGGYEGG